MTLHASIFVGVSLDGYIARRDGALDFLPPGGGEPHGYEEFLKSVDALVLGRKTYETAIGFGAWPYKDKRVFVLSKHPLKEGPPDAKVGRLSGDPVGIVKKLDALGVKHAYVDGGHTIQEFLRAGLIHRLIVTRVPVLIGQGIPLFGHLPHDIKLEHVSTKSYPSGLVQSEYKVQPS